MKTLQPGDRVDVDLEVMNDAGVWVTSTEEGRVVSYNEKESEVTVYWDGDAEPYVCGSQFVKLTMKSGDIIVVENEVETSEGVWENVLSEAVVIDPPNSCGEVTVKMIESGDLYTTPREYISSSAASRGANSSFSPQQQYQHKRSSPTENSLCATSNRGSIRSVPLLRASLDPSSYSDRNLSGEWFQKASNKTPNATLVINHVIGKSLTLNGEVYSLDGNTRMEPKKRRSTWASTTSKGLEIVHEDKSMKMRKIISLSATGDAIQIVETKSKISTGLVLSKDILAFSRRGEVPVQSTDDKSTSPDENKQQNGISNTKTDSESIPISRYELRDTMARDLPKDQLHDFYRFAASVSAVVDSQYSELPEIFLASDAQQLPSLLKLCSAANYLPLTQQQWDTGVVNRLKTTDNKTLIPDLKSFLSIKQELLANYFEVNPYRWDLDNDDEDRSDVPEFAHNTIIMTKGQPSEDNGDVFPSVVVAYVEDESLSVVVYQDIPKSDIALLLPNSGTLLPFMSKIYFIGSVLPFLVFIYFGITEGIDDNQTQADLSMEYLLCLMIFLSGCILKLCGLLYTFSFMKITLAGTLSDWKCQRAKASADTALQTLVTEAVDQEVKEILLAYFILWRSTESCLPAFEVQQRITAFFDKNFPTIHCSLEFNDAIHKLLLLKLARSESSKGYYKLGFSPKQFLNSKSDDWAGLLSNHFEEVIDARLR